MKRRISSTALPHSITCSRRELPRSAGTSSELQLGSPFDYDQQCTVYLEVGLPPPDDRDFLSAAMDRAMHYLRQTEGRAFVLFTSYAMLDLPRKSWSHNWGRWATRCSPRATP